ARPGPKSSGEKYLCCSSQLAGRWCVCRGRPESEFGESRCAPRPTPTPNRSTSSPPGQPVTNANTTAMNESVSAPVLGSERAGLREIHLTINSRTTSIRYLQELDNLVKSRAILVRPFRRRVITRLRFMSLCGNRRHQL